jgi:hypothetical protein
MDKNSGALRQTRIGDGLALSGDNTILAYRDTATGLEYLRRARDFHHHGLTLALRGYQHVVLLDWRELHPSAEQPWDRLCDALHGEGVPSVDAALSMLRLRPLHDALHQALSPESIRALAEIANELAAQAIRDDASEELLGERVSNAPADPQLRAEQLQSFLDHCTLFFYRAIASLPAENRDLASRLAESGHTAQSYRETSQQRTVAAIHLALTQEEFAADWPSIARIVPSTDQQWALLAAWIVLGSLPWQGDLTAAFDSLHLRQALAEIFSAVGAEGEAIWRSAAKVRALLLQADAPQPRDFWNDGDVRWLAGIHESDGVTWVNKEGFEELIDNLQLPALLEAAEDDSRALEVVIEIEAEIENAREAMSEAAYRLDAFLDLQRFTASPSELPIN